MPRDKRFDVITDEDLLQGARDLVSGRLSTQELADQWGAKYGIAIHRQRATILVKGRMGVAHGRAHDGTYSTSGGVYRFIPEAAHRALHPEDVWPPDHVPDGKQPPRKDGKPRKPRGLAVAQKRARAEQEKIRKKAERDRKREELLMGTRPQLDAISERMWPTDTVQPLLLSDSLHAVNGSDSAQEALEAIATLKQKLAVAMAGNAILITALDATRDELAQLHAAHNEVEAAYHNLEDPYRYLQNAYSDTQESLKQTHRQNQALTAERDQLTIQLRKAQHEADTIWNGNQTLWGRIKALEPDAKAWRAYQANHIREHVTRIAEEADRQTQVIDAMVRLPPDQPPVGYIIEDVDESGQPAVISAVYQDR